MYGSVLVANRGEIALRIISTLQDHGIEAVVTSSDLDLEALPAKRADKVVHLEGKLPQETYLNIEKITAAAEKYQVDAIHPGYGFLSENPNFVEAVLKTKINFIGPDPLQMKTFGDKIAARELAKTSDTPLIPGSEGDVKEEDLAEIAKNLGYPVILKAAGGGGGRGIRVVRKAEDLEDESKIAKREAKLAFNDDRVYVEKFIPQGRHVEVQILADGEGNALHLGERDCSLQRKNQKLVEEAPAPFLSKNLIDEIHQAAVNLVTKANYKNAGTVEFLVDGDKFYFLEVNARIQVEHPVTEMITGEDLVWRQLQISSGEDLELEQQDIQFRGHAIEARIYAENPYDGFSPSPGYLSRVKHPFGSGVRVDSAIEDNNIISPFYDPLISKVITHSPNRAAATRKMINTLENYIINGVHTTIPYIQHIMESKDFSDFNYSTRYLENKEFQIPDKILLAARAAASFFQKRKQNASKQVVTRNNTWRNSYREMS